MYLEYYKLKEQPFSLTPDPAFLYNSKAHKRAIAFLKYGLQESKGFLQLTGPVGSGKTTLLRAILGGLDESARTAYIINPRASFPDLLRSIMKDLEIPNIPDTRVKIELLDFFHDYLLLQSRRGASVIAIFDEAQNLSVKNLEEIRMLSNFETTKGKLIQIVFVGQPELKETLDRPDLRQLKQRIQVRYHLSPLSRAEVKAYIDHRLEIAGSDGAIDFSDEACDAIYDFSGGIPRLINSVCDIALLIGYVAEKKCFDADIVKEAICELGGSFQPEQSEDDVAPEPEVEAPGVAQGDLAPTARDCESSQQALAAGSNPVGESGQGVPASVGADDTGEGEPAFSGSEAGEGDAGLISQTENSAPDIETPPIDEAGETSAALIEPEVAVAIANPPEEIQGEIEEELQEGAVPVEIGKDEEPAARDSNSTASAPGSPRTSSELNGKAVEASKAPELRRPDGDMLHSRLRHGGTGRFRAMSANERAPSGARRYDGGEDGLLRRLRRLVGRYTGKGADGDCAALDAALPASVGNGLEGTDALRESESEPKRSIFSPLALQFSATSWLRREGGSKRNGQAKRVRSARRRKGQSTGKSAGRADSVDIVALMTDGGIILGGARNISIKEDGFYLTSSNSQDDQTRKRIAFKDTLAIRFPNDREQGWEKNFSSAILKPKGRQAVVTLSNGEVIEGFTPRMFNPDCPRFFVVATDDDGETSWALVERTGALGVLTENFKEGIYAEKAVSLLDVPETFISAAESVCCHESSGDVRFSMGDLDAAVREYSLARDNGADKERVDLKTSLSHYNLALRHLKKNRYLEARAEFLKVTSDPPTLEKARARAEMIDRIIDG